MRSEREATRRVSGSARQRYRTPLPALTQNVGLRVILAVFRVDFVIDPAKPSRHELGVSLSVP